MYFSLTRKTLQLGILHVVDAQKRFASMISSLLHTNSSNFIILVTLIFWPNWSYFIICILFHINFMSTRNHPKSTRNHSKSVLVNPKHIKHRINHHLSTPRYCCGFQRLGNLSTYQSYQFDLSIVMALSARLNYHSCHPIFDIVEAFNVRSWYHWPF